MEDGDIERYDGAVHAIYGAATAPARWPEAAAAVAAAMRAPQAMLHAVSLPTGGVDFTFAHGIPQRALQLWAARGVGEDPFVQVAQRRRLYTDGRVVIGDEVVPRHELVRTAFYRELWQPIGIAQLCAGIVFGSTDSMTSPTIMAVYRGPGDPSFDDGDRAMMRRLLPHLSRALGVMFHLRGLELRAASQAAVLDALQSAVLLLDRTGQVLSHNSACKALLQAGDLLCRGAGGGIELAPGLQDSAALQRLLRGAVRTSGRPPRHFADAVVLRDAEGRPRGVVHAAPWNGGDADPARAVVFVYDLAAAALEPEALVRLLGLTPAEARAALQVLAGNDAAAAARRLGIRPTTYKTQLRAVFAKTMTSRQSDLLKLLLSLTAG